MGWSRLLFKEYTQNHTTPVVLSEAVDTSFQVLSNFTDLLHIATCC